MTIDARAVDAAAERLAGVVTRTPLQLNERLSDRTGAEVWLKREDLQPVRSYKLRGAYNLIAQLDPAAPRGGRGRAPAPATTARGVAFACRALGITGGVFVPATTPRQKRERIPPSAAGVVELVVVRRHLRRGRRGGAPATRATTGATLVPAFDDPRTIAGQGTVGEEIIEQLGRAPDVLVVPVGGGGLIAGCAGLAARAAPAVRGGRGRAGRRGLHGGGAGRGPAGGAGPDIDTFVDGAAVRGAGDADLPDGAATRGRSWTPSPRAGSAREMLALYQTDGIIAEPAGRAGHRRAGRRLDVEPGQTVVCVLSGGNNDVCRYAEIVERSLVHEGRKHYFLVDFPQEPGALRRFLDEVLGPDDDITHVRVRQAQQPRDRPGAGRHRARRTRGPGPAAGADGGRAAADREGRQRQPAVPVPAVTPPGFAAGHDCRDDGGPMTLTDLLPPEPDPDALYDAFAGWAEGRGLELYPAQEEALIELVTGANVILATPTGSGKSLVATGAHFAALAAGRRTLLHRADQGAGLARSSSRCATIFGAENVGMLTGDAAVNADAPIICCTAEILANIALREGARRRRRPGRDGRVPLLRRARPRLGLAGAAARAAAGAVPADVGDARRRHAASRRT